MSEYTEIKKSLLFQSIELLQEKIDVLQNTSNESNAKKGQFEANRSSMVLEKLQNIDPHNQFERAKFGAVVKTRLANYFIAISAGRMEVKGEKFYVIAAHTPLAQELLYKKEGDTFLFNEKETKILEIF